MEKVSRNSFALSFLLSKKLVEWLGLEGAIKAPLSTIFPIPPGIPFQSDNLLAGRGFIRQKLCMGVFDKMKSGVE